MGMGALPRASRKALVCRKIFMAEPLCASNGMLPELLWVSQKGWPGQLLKAVVPSQVRFAACVAARSFMLAVGADKERVLCAAAAKAMLQQI